MILRAFVGSRQRPQHFIIFLYWFRVSEREKLGYLFPVRGTPQALRLPEPMGAAVTVRGSFCTVPGGVPPPDFTQFLATFYAVLGDIPPRNVLRFSGLRAVFFFIYFIYIIK